MIADAVQTMLAGKQTDIQSPPLQPAVCPLMDVKPQIKGAAVPPKGLRSDSQRTSSSTLCSHGWPAMVIPAAAAACPLAVLLTSKKGIAVPFNRHKCTDISKFLGADRPAAQGLCPHVYTAALPDHPRRGGCLRCWRLSNLIDTAVPFKLDKMH